MKVNNLAFPNLEMDKIKVQDRILHLPMPCEDRTFHFPGWHDPAIFGNHNPVAIEHCSGNGAWIAHKAALFPTLNWVAVEKQLCRVKKIWFKIKSLNLANLFIISGEAALATKTYFPSDSVCDVFINFPDPWPKQKHTKHRLLSENFINEMHRILQPQRKVTFVTDDKTYSENTIKKFQKSFGFESCFPDPFFQTALENYGTSYFEELWRQKGKEIRYHQFIKQMAENHE